MNIYDSAISAMKICFYIFYRSTWLLGCDFWEFIVGLANYLAPTRKQTPIYVPSYVGMKYEC